MKQAHRINYCLLLSVFHVYRRKSISTFLIEPTDSKEKREEALFRKVIFVNHRVTLCQISIFVYSFYIYGNNWHKVNIFTQVSQLSFSIVVLKSIIYWPLFKFFADKECPTFSVGVMNAFISKTLFFGCDQNFKKVQLKISLDGLGIPYQRNPRNLVIFPIQIRCDFLQFEHTLQNSICRHRLSNIRTFAKQKGQKKQTKTFKFTRAPVCAFSRLSSQQMSQ